MRILIIEDEVTLAEIIQRKLTDEYYVVDIASDGDSGLELLFVNEYDVVILDLMLPKKSGLELLSELRQAGHKVPVLVLTAKDKVEDKVEGLNIGADDYLTKPFAFEELLARIKALLRRKIKEENNILKNGDLIVDTAKYQVTRAGRKIPLTSKEYILLEYLMRNRGYVLTRSQIEEHVWEYGEFNSSNIVDVYIRFLRKKIDDDFEVKLIETVRGKGYRLKVVDNDS